MDKQRIIAEIKRIATANGGKPPGMMVFERETGISKNVWYPDLWLRWSDALVEAGYPPNKWLQEAIPEEVVIQRYIGLVRELGRIPVVGEMMRKAKSYESFPSHTVFIRRFGSKAGLLEAVTRYCQEHPGNDDIIAVCAEHKAQDGGEDAAQRRQRKVATGFVYLMKRELPICKGGDESRSCEARQARLKPLRTTPVKAWVSIEVGSSLQDRPDGLCR